MDKIDETEKELRYAEKRVGEAEEALKKAKENELVASKKRESAVSDYGDLLKLLNKSEKRVLIVTKIAFKEHGKMSEQFEIKKKSL